MNDEQTIVLYDGVCGFCHSSVQFIIKRDPRRRFRFASLQSDVGRSLAEAHGIDASQLEGLILIDASTAYQKSSAALRIARGLNWPWPVFAALLLVPKMIRDWCYDQFAKRRYRWFGKLDACSIPSADVPDRFLCSIHNAVTVRAP